MAEPAQRRTDESGGKYYQHPTRTDVTRDGEPARYDSVTTALDVLDKPGLKWWAPKIAARRAMENLPKLVGSQLVEPCERTWARSEPYRCDQCPDCVQRWVELYHVGEAARRRREGSALHDCLEWWVLRGEWPDLVAIAAIQNQDETQDRITAADLEPYLVMLKQWVEDYGIEPRSFLAAEMTVWHHVHRYAGTLDGILRLEPVTRKAAKLCARIRPALQGPNSPVDVVVDLKSREGEDKQFYESMALQLAAYRNAQTATLKISGQEAPMPHTHGGVILQVRPDGYTFEPVLTEINELSAFLSTLGLHRWMQKRGAASIAVKTFPVPDGWEYVEGSYVRGAGTPAGDADHTATGAEPAAGATPVAGPPPPTETPPAKKAAPRARKATKAAAPAAPADATAPRVAGATLDSLRRAPGDHEPHPDSPYNDNIPF